MKEFYITDDRIRLHAKLETPDGREKCPLILLFHGFTGDMEEAHIVGVKDAMLESGCAVLIVELYGHGKSEGEFKDHTLFKWFSNAMCAVCDGPLHLRALPGRNPCDDGRRRSAG